MIVVSNTSPLRYLVLIGVENVLPVLFGDVLVPPVVLNELGHAHSPELVRQWMSHAPAWLKVQTPKSLDATLEVDLGEAAAISLALEVRADALLIDDRKGRSAAKARSIVTVGTLTVLEIAAERGLITLPESLAALRQTNFRLSERMIQQVLRRDQTHRKGESST